MQVNLVDLGRLLLEKILLHTYRGHIYSLAVTDLANP